MGAVAALVVAGIAVPSAFVAGRARDAAQNEVTKAKNSLEATQKQATKAESKYQAAETRSQAANLKYRQAQGKEKAARQQYQQAKQQVQLAQVQLAQVNQQRGVATQRAEAAQTLATIAQRQYKDAQRKAEQISQQSKTAEANFRTTNTRTQKTVKDLGEVLSGFYQTNFDDKFLEFLSGVINKNSQNSFALVSRGSIFSESKKDYSAAEKDFRHAVEIDPQDYYAWGNLGNVLRTQNKLKEAVSAYQNAIKFIPDNQEDSPGSSSTADVQRNQIVTSLSKPERLISGNNTVNYQQIVFQSFQSQVTKKAIFNNLGNVLYAIGKLDEAVAAYRKAIELDPKNTDAYSGLGYALSAQKKLDEAVAAYRKAIELDPKNTDAYSGLGYALSAQNKLDEAVAVYRKAIELDPKYVYAYNGLGYALSAQNKLDEAVAAYRKAIELDPKNTYVYTNLGYALSAQNKLDEAVAAYRKAIELDPKNTDAYTNLGYALSAQNKLDEAVAVYRKAIELDPRYVGFYINLGDALRNQNKLDEAVAAYRKVLSLPNQFGTPTSAHAYAYTNLGNTLRAQNKLDEAVAAYRKAIELDPKYTDAYNGLGKALNNQNKLQEEIALHPDLRDKISAETWNNICWLGSIDGEAALVLFACDEAVTRDSKYRDARGLARALTGDRQGAIEDFQAFVRWLDQNKPEHAAAQKAQRQSWLDGLRAGKQPAAIFTKEVLEQLRKQ